MTERTDLEKTRALLRLVSATDGSVTLSGATAALVADALGEVEQLRSDRDRLQKLCDKTALAAANRVLQRQVNEGERVSAARLSSGDGGDQT